MKLARSLSLFFPFLFLAISTFGAGAWSAENDAHQAHHPVGMASAPTNKSVLRKPVLDTAPIDTQMKAMQQMHDKMMAVSTPEERNALMAEQMKSMHDGMVMMGGMQTGNTVMKSMSGDMAMHHQTMEKRMDMMQSMMQMMIDRLSIPSGK